MIRAFRCLLWFLAGFLFSAYAVVSHASTYSISVTMGNSACTYGQGSSSFSDPDLSVVANNVAGFANGRGCPGYSVSATNIDPATGAFTLKCAKESSQCASTTLTAQIGPSTCTSTSTISSGYYDWGTSTSSNKYFVCSGGCNATFSGDFPIKSSVVNGVTHYWAKGSYAFTGAGSVDSCTSGNGAPSASASIPTSSCASDQIAVTVNGQVRCYVRQTGAQATTTTNTTSSTSTTNSSTATNADGSKTVTTTTTDSNGTTTTKNETYAPGTDPNTAKPTAVTVTTTGSGNATDPNSYYCQQHPQERSCLAPWAPGSGTPSDWPNLDADLASAKQAIADKMTQIRAEASNLVGSVGSGTSSLSCDSVQVSHLGTNFSLCFSNYSQSLNAVGAVIVAVAWIAAAFILLR